MNPLIYMPRICIPLALMAMAIPASAFDNIEIEKSKIPAIALKTAQFYAPGITFTRYAYEDENGHRIYEFEGEDANGKHIEIDMMADGSLQEIEMETDWQDVPPYIQIELRLSNPNMQIDFVETSTRADGTIVYEIEGQENGIFMDVEIANTGHQILNLAQSQAGALMPMEGSN